MVPMSWVSWRIDAIGAESTRSGMLDTPWEVLFSEFSEPVVKGAWTWHQWRGWFCQAGV